MIRTLAALLCATGPAAAQDAATWLATETSLEVTVTEAGQWHPVGGQIHATDPLTLFQTGPDVPTLAVPDAPAQVLGLHYEHDFGDDVTERRTAVIVLIWSDAPVACGADLTSVAVDTGLASFLTPAQVEALAQYEDRYGPSYVAAVPGPFEQQIEAQYPGPFLTDLPGDLSFPVTGSGWGDGAYPVVSLHDADGAMVALYAQFITADGEDWLLPPPCPQAAP